MSLPRAQPVPLDAIARKINREIVVVLGWGRAILMQFAHPLVAAGVADYSTFRADTRGYAGRARGTVGAMLALTFGSEEEILAAASHINSIHDRVNGVLRERAGLFPAGTRYSARDPELLRWVHATLIDSEILVYDLLVGPLTDDEKDRYCAEAATIAPLLGIPDGFLPDNLADHQRYLRGMFSSGEIEVTATARKLAHGLLSPPVSRVAAPLFAVLRLSTIGLLPVELREAYGFPWSSRRDRWLRRFVTATRRVRRVTPRILREWPAARKSASALSAPKHLSSADVGRRHADVPNLLRRDLEDVALENHEIRQSAGR